jgi:phage terminase Nu1 subunit (DNA packaging protein)
LEGTTKQACDLLDVDSSTLTIWKGKGLDESGAYLERNKWDLSKLIIWWAANISTPTPEGEPSLAEERLRYERLRADKMELEVAERRRDLLSREEVEASLSELITVAKKAFLLLPKTALPKLKGKSDPDQIKALTTMCEDILRGIKEGAKIEKIEAKIKSSS